MKWFSKKKNLRIKHQAKVFISRKDETAIVVSLHYNGVGGFLFEDNTPIIVKPPFDVAAIGGQMLNALRQTQVREVVSFAGHKLKDWPAFQASKAKSVVQFEQDYIQIMVSGANEMNLVYSIDGSPEKDADFSRLHVVAIISSSASTHELGERIRQVYLACKTRQI